MEPTYLVLLLAVLATSATAITPNYPVPSFTGFTPYAYSNFAAPRTLPFRPLFSYGYQAEAPVTPVFSPAIVPATAFSRVIYANNASPKTPMNDLYRGFSYQTRYTNGGRSEVIFVTGPESKKLMEQNVEFFRSILLPPNNAANMPASSAPPSQETRTTNTESRKTEDKLPASPLPNIQQSSVFRFQLFPAHTSPFLGSPLPLHSMINSYFQTLGHSPTAPQQSVTENSDQYNAEAQESMISELGRILAPDVKSAVSENSESQSLDARANSVDSNTIDTPSSSNAPVTTQISTSESNSQSTEQASTDSPAARSNVISDTQMQETTNSQTLETTSTRTQEIASAQTPETTSTQTQEPISAPMPETTSNQTPETTSASTEETVASEQSSTEDNTTTSEASSSTDSQPESTEQSSSSEQTETTTITEARSEGTNTGSAETLAESA